MSVGGRSSSAAGAGALTFLDQLDQAFAALDGWIEAMLDAELEAPAGDGWTRGAVLAHLAAWQDAATYRLYRFEATGQPQDTLHEDVDAFNAQVSLETAGRTGTQLREALTRSFRRLREAYAGLDPEARGFDWAAEMVHGNSIGHYEEHRADLGG